jgi:predicted Zn-dependent protease
MAPEDGNALMVLSLSAKNNLTQAEQAYMETHQFEVTSRNNRQVNGLNARVVQGRQVDEQNQQVINILLYFIEYEGRVYQLLGMAYQQQYGNYESSFLRTMNGFDRLTDASKINVQPERIKIVKAPRTTNLRSLLTSNGIPNDRLEEFAILNGMELNTQVESGTLFKVVDKARN